MGLFKGGFLRLFQTGLYALAFCCAAIVLGIYSYYLAVLSDRNLPLAKWKLAVEGLSGCACVYTILTTLLTCCLAGITFLSLLGIVLDVCFVGAFIAIAIMTRHGASSCKGNVNTPLGSGPANSNASGYGSNGFGFGKNENSTYAPNLGLACRLNTAAFAVSIIAIFLFILTAVMQLALIRNHKKEKAFGPSPANNYTSGRGSRAGVFGRKNKDTPDSAEKGIIGNGADVRPSHDTAYTGSTVAAPGAHLQKDEPPLPTTTTNSHAGHAPHVGWNPHENDSRGDYYSAPVGTANPYGYDNTTTANTGAARNF